MAASRTLNAVFEALRRASDTLAAAKLRFALIGGLAVSVRGQPRFTNDVDFAVAVESDLEAETGHLIALKVLSESPRRLQDRLDLDGLLAVAGPRELRRAREALALIEERGCSRKKDLAAGLVRAIRSAQKSAR